MRRLVLAALISVLIPLLASAQRSSGFAGGRMPSVAPPVAHSMAAPHGPVANAVPTRPIGSHAGAHSGAPRLRAAGSHKPAGSPVLPQPSHPIFRGNLGFNNGFGSGFFNNGNTFPVPGFGFDYEHFFALHPNWGARNRVAGVVLPFWGGGLYVPMPYYSEGQPQQQAAQETSSEPRETSEESAQREETAPVRMHANYYAAAPAIPEYVFVKRDGSMFYAVAYSWTKDKLQYITNEGLRRVASLDSLDLDATQKSNEERGNTLTLPTPGPSKIALAIPAAELR